MANFLSNIFINRFRSRAEKTPYSPLKIKEKTYFTSVFVRKKKKVD